MVTAGNLDGLIQDTVSVPHGDTASDILAEFLGLVDDFDFDVKAVYVEDPNRTL